MTIMKRKRKNAEGVVVMDTAWTIQFTDHSGTKRRLPGFKSKADLDKAIHLFG